MSDSLKAAAEELHELMHGRTKLLYAFAMNSTLELNDKITQAIRERDAQLRAIIAEHEGKDYIS